MSHPFLLELALSSERVLSAAALVALGACALQLVLAGALLALGFERRAHRAFALVLVFFSAWLAVNTLALANAFGDAELWARLVPYAIMPLGLTVLNFVSVFPKTRPAALPRRVTASALTLIGGSLVAWYMRDHAAFSSEVGVLFDGLFDLSFAIAALVLVLDLRRQPAGPHRTSLMLMSLGFFAPAACLCIAWRMLIRVFGSTTPLGVPPSTLYDIMLIAQVTIVLAMVGLIFEAARRDTEIRKASLALLVLLTISLVVGVAVLLAMPSPLVALPTVLGLLGAWNVMGDALVVYALTKYRLFDIDLTIKWTLRRGTVAAIFVAVFFIVAQIAQSYLTGAFGWLAGGAAAGLLLFAIRPLERAADRIADKAMPRVQNTSEYRTVRKREVYRAAVESALEDGVVTDKERGMLATLADQLGLTVSETVAIEREITATRSN